jgi:hypothetical protein
MHLIMNKRVTVLILITYLTLISVIVQLRKPLFLVISMQFNLRNVLRNYVRFVLK